MRLDKFICKSTELSRVEARAVIAAGEVTVNGESALLDAMQVHAHNNVEYQGQRLIPRAFRYLLLHKPADMVCSNIDEAYPSAFRCLNMDNVSELHMVGRLDADTTGLVLITDDGGWSFQITRPEQNCPKVYRVHLAKPLYRELIEQFAQGMMLQGEANKTRPATLELLAGKEARLTITEGKFHQVKRMFASVGNRVIALHREQIGSVSLDVPLGTWRYLTEAEVQSFL